MIIRAIHPVMVVATAALMLGACSDPEATHDSVDAAIPETGSTDGSAAHSAAGTVDSIDAASGTVTISHEPVASIGWPAMIMSFRLADNSLADALEPGRRIVKFTTEGGATVTAVEPAR